MIKFAILAVFAAIFMSMSASPSVTTSLPSENANIKIQTSSNTLPSTIVGFNGLEQTSGVITLN